MLSMWHKRWFELEGGALQWRRDRGDADVKKRLVLAPGALKIISSNAEQEDAQEEIELDYAGDGLEVGFNVTYLLDVLNNLKCDQVNIALGDSNSSALISIPDNADFKYVVMPMRI